MREHLSRLKDSGSSRKEYWSRVKEHWIFLAGALLLVVVGTVQVVRTDVALPWWAWFVLATACVCGAQYLAFHDVRIERDEATEAARAFDLHAREYERWANRREVAEDFVWDTLLCRDRILSPEDPRPSYQQDDRPIEELEAEWRTKVANVIARLEAEGADHYPLNEAENNLAALGQDDRFGENYRRRLWDNMCVIPQSLRNGIAKGPRPIPPISPEKPESEKA